MKGLIFNIEEFAVHDGPGIRKLVFFKGCPLHCSWCHNPEGISFRKELMVSRASCVHCGRCSQACSSDECITCGKCVDVCPLRLRKICGEETEAADLAGRLMKGKDILISSGGGITISGGEPLAQPAFLFDLIGHLKPLNIAVETSGHAAEGIFRQMTSMVDLVLMDLKHTDPVIHKKFTGVDNSLIMKNLKILCEGPVDFCIRIPLIPGVNDSRENMIATARLLKDAGNLKKVDLLPYHQTAGAKYPMVGRVFNPGFDTARAVSIRKEIFEAYHIHAEVL
jgi:pyruvate formate lyase activating enzyme